MSQLDVPLSNATALKDELFRGWMPGSHTRSTADILWTCVATILLCVYTAVHLNVPPPGEPKRWQFLRRVKWVIIAILAPEVVLHFAWKQFFTARHLQRTLKEHVKKHRADTSLTTATVYDSCDDQSTGIPLLPSSNPSETKLPSERVANLDDIPEESDITLVYAFYAIMGGFYIKSTADGKIYYPTPLATAELAECGIFWNISTSSIQDKSKADGLAKFLAVGQVLWMFIQCATRLHQHLPLTILEIHTFVHAVCAFTMFFLWFKKPLDVRDGVGIKWSSQSSNAAQQEVMKKLISNMEVDDQAVRFTLRQPNFGVTMSSPRSSGHRDSSAYALATLMTRDDMIGWNVSGENASVSTILGTIVIQVLYGGLHAAAWNAYFPSNFEKWSWRVSCIVIASGYCLFLTVSAVVYILGMGGCAMLWIFFYSLILGPAWLCARFFLVIESLIALRAVPVGVYAAIQWADYFPHI